MINLPTSRSKGIIAIIAAAVSADIISRIARAISDKVYNRTQQLWDDYSNIGGGSRPSLTLIDASHTVANGFAPYQKWTEAYIRLGLVIPSFSDYYHAGQSASEKTLEHIRVDMETQIVHTSTMHKYSKDSLECAIAEYCGLSNSSDLGSVPIPAYSVANLSEIVSSRDGLKYIQTICKTTDPADRILFSLSRLAGVHQADIFVTTPALKGEGMPAPREQSQNRTLSMTYTLSGGRKRLFLLGDIEDEPGVVHILTVRRSGGSQSISDGRQ